MDLLELVGLVIVFAPTNSMMRHGRCHSSSSANVAAHYPRFMKQLIVHVLQLNQRYLEQTQFLFALSTE